MQVRLQTRAPDGPKGMFTTFVHILKTDSFLGLYRGVCMIAESAHAPIRACKVGDINGLQSSLPPFFASSPIPPRDLAYTPS